MGEIGCNRKKMKCADQTCGSSESREGSVPGFWEEVAFRLGFERRIIWEE